MLLREVESSNLESIGYDCDKQVLGVVMKSAPETIYAYNEVPLNTYLELLNSESKGKFFINAIKGKFQFRKISR